MQSWEGRFKSQALLDEQALISCMAYVDLNPIRARMATTPEKSEHTSIQKRIYQAAHPSLEQFVGISNESIGIPFKLRDYIELVDFTGRIVREDKRGAIDGQLPSILQRLNLDKDNWSQLSTEFEDRFNNWVSSEHIAKSLGIDSTELSPP